MSTDENLSLTNTVLESNENLLKNDLTKTPDKIAEHLNVLLNRSEDLGNGFKNSKTIIDKIKESETKVLAYAQQLMAFKNQLENDKSEFEKELKNRQTALENDIVDIAKQLADLQTNRQNITTQLSKCQQEKDIDTQKINDMHGMDDDLIKEEQEIVDRISLCQTILDDIEFKNPQFDITKLKEEIATTELLSENIKESIINMTQQQELLKNAQNKLIDQSKTIQGNITSAKKAPHIPLLKRNLSVQNEELNLYEDEKYRNERKLNECKTKLQKTKSAISTSKETRKQFQDEKDKYKKLIDLTQNQIVKIEEEANELSKSNKLMKQCKTMKEFELMQKIISIQANKLNILHKIGEIKVIKKEYNQKIPQMNIKLNHLQDKLKKADEAEELIHLVGLKIKNNQNQIENQVKEDEEKFKISLNTLRQLNDHIAFSEKVQNELNTHHFANNIISDVNLEPTIKEKTLTYQLENIMKTIKKLKRKINNIQSKVKKPNNLIKCPLFIHETQLNQQENINYLQINQHENSNYMNQQNCQNRKKINILLSNDELDSLIYYHKNNIEKRRLEIITRKKRMQSVCDYYADQSSDYIAYHPKKLCDGAIHLCPSQQCIDEELFLKIITEKNKWQKISHGTSQMLIAWNNQVEHML